MDHSVFGAKKAFLHRDGLTAPERVRARTSGFLAWLLWTFVHILTLPQLRKRVRVQRQWLWSYLIERNSRLLNERSRG